MKKLIFSTVVIFSLYHCTASTVASYTSPEFSAEKKNHKRLAILPFKVIRENDKNSTDTYANSYSYIAQNNIFASLIDQNNAIEKQIEIQDIDRTNSLITKAGLSNTSLTTVDKAEMCKVLGVDVVLSGLVQLPSKVVAIKNNKEVVVSQYNPSEKVKMSISIHDAQKAKLIWKNDAETDIYTDLDYSIKLLNRNLVKNFPYKK